ncbi:MAG: MoaD/ThiS family protein [Candidatus Thorarchaeota archaeon]|nr:MAG: MoaD/ThiS family protein [Candidatus Thorarchaeota archaeon]
MARTLNENSVNLELRKGSTVREAITVLIESNDSVRQVWTSPEHVDREALVMCNGADIGLTGGIDTVLGNEDEIVILPLIHGGV